MAKTVVTSKGQVTIPKLIRDKAKITTGTELDFQFENGRLTVRPISKDITSIKGMVKSRRKSPVSLKEMKQTIRARAQKNLGIKIKSRHLKRK